MLGLKDFVILAAAFAGMAGGLLWPAQTRPLASVIAQAMIIILFFSFLKLSPGHIWLSLKKYPGRLAFLISLKLLVIPWLVYRLALFFAPDIALGLLFLAGASTAVMVPFLISVVGGDVALGLVMAVMTSLLVPFSLPFVARAAAAQALNLNLVGLALFLAGVIFIPLAASLLCRRFWPRLARWLEGQTYAVSVCVFGLVNLGVFGKYAPFFSGQLSQIIWALVLGSVLAVLMAMLGWAVLWASPPSSRVAAAGTLCWVNNVLVIVVGSYVNDPWTSVLGGLYMLPTFLMILPLAWLVRAYERPGRGRLRPLRPSPLDKSGGRESSRPGL